MNKTLLLLRHAKSSWDFPSLADDQRPLNDRGRQAASLIGSRLQKENVQFDIVICSTSVRTRETASLVFAQLKSNPEIIFRHDLYHASADQIGQILKDVSEPMRTAMLIGHNPGFEEFVERTTGQAGNFPTAALAHIDLDLERWNMFDRDTHGRLVEMWRPKEMKNE